MARSHERHPPARPSGLIVSLCADTPASLLLETLSPVLSRRHEAEWDARIHSQLKDFALHRRSLNRSSMAATRTQYLTLATSLAQLDLETRNCPRHCLRHFPTGKRAYSQVVSSPGHPTNERCDGQSSHHKEQRLHSEGMLDILLNTRLRHDGRRGIHSLSIGESMSPQWLHNLHVPPHCSTCHLCRQSKCLTARASPTLPITLPPAAMSRAQAPAHRAATYWKIQQPHARRLCP